MKEVIRRDKESSFLIFDDFCIRETVEDAAKKYGKSDLILILQTNTTKNMVDLGFVDAVDESTSTNFQGVYLVSPAHKWWGNQGEKEEEDLVHVIKDAFI